MLPGQFSPFPAELLPFGETDHEARTTFLYCMDHLKQGKECKIEQTAMKEKIVVCGSRTVWSHCQCTLTVGCGISMEILNYP